MHVPDTTAAQSHHLPPVLCVMFLAACLPLHAADPAAKAERPSRDDGSSTPAVQSGPSAPAPPALGSNEISRLVELLGHRERKVREEADRKLRELPLSAVETLQQLLKAHDDPEVTVRLKEIIASILPPLDQKYLNSIIVPEIDFKQANLSDCLRFLEKACETFGPRTANGALRRVQIVVNVGTTTDEDLINSITFSARRISALEALKIICNVANLRFTIEKGMVIVRPLNTGLP